MAVFASNSIETGNDHAREIYALILGVFMSTAMTLGIEKREKPLMWLAMSQAVVIGLTAAYYFLVLDSYVPMSVKEILRLVILCFALLFVCLWVPCLRWKTDFNDYFMTFFKAFFTTGFFMSIIWGGISLVLSAVDSLLFSIPENLFIHMAVWIYVFFAPMLFLSLIPVFGGTEEDKKKEEHLARIPPFFRALLSYVLIPLTAMYTLVLLAYLVKTLVSGDQGDLLRPLILAYCIVVISLYILVSGIDNKISALFRMIAPKLMLLIALYQVIQLISKIPSEGVEYGRYFVILFGIYSVAAGVLMSVLPLKKNVILGIVLTGFALVSVIPPVDAFTYSTLSQVRIVEQVLNDNSMIKDGAIVPDSNLSDEDEQKITDGMQYLYDIKETDKVQGVSADFEMYLDFEEVFGFSPYYDSGYIDVEDTSIWFSLDSSSPINISTYEYMVNVQGNNYGGADRDDVVVSVTDQGTRYDIAIVTDGSQIRLELRDESGVSMISAAVNDLIDSLEGTETQSAKEMMSAEKMTFDVEGAGASMRIIFEYASRNGSDSNVTYDSNMKVLIRID